MIIPNKNIQEQLDALEVCLRHGHITPARAVDDGTLVCMVTYTPVGKCYWQGLFDAMHKDWQNALKGKTKCAEIPTNGMPWKLIAVFDVWA